MAFKRVCPRCAEFVSRKDAKCPFCGEILREDALDDGKLGENELEKLLNGKPSGNLSEIAPNAEDKNIADLNNAKMEATEAEKAVKPAQAQQAKLAPQEKAKETEENAQPAEAETATIAPKRHSHKKKAKKFDAPEVQVEENGELNINTNDVTFFEGAKETYSQKKARGEAPKDKIEWWEIYKWADLYLARRKINKEVNKAAVVEPSYINHTVLALLCLFFGAFGAHNFYAKNKKRGWFVLISIIISMVVISIPQLEGVINISVGGGLGFVVVSMWVWDLIAILFRKYKFRESKLKFICKLNLETRKKLGKKYVTINQWFVPYEKRQKKSKKMRQTKI